MNWMARLRLKAATALAPITGRMGPLWNSVRESFTGAWQRNVQVDSRDNLLAFSAVFACVTRIANDIGKLPIRLVEEGTGTEAGVWTPVNSLSPYWAVLRKPNRYQTHVQFVVTWLLSKLITGNTYVLKQRDERGIVVALYLLDPNRVKVLVSTDGGVYYELSKDHLSQISDESVVVPSSEVIHDLMNPMFHPLQGVSPLYACGAAATQGARMQANSSKFFENMSRPSGVLTAPGEIKDDTAKRMKDHWESNFSGANAGKVAVLGDGLKYEAMTIPASDAQLIEQLRWTAEDVARAYGVPLYKINAGPVPTSNNVEALNQQYYSDCLQVHIESIEACLDAGLEIGQTGATRNYGTEFDLDVLLRMDSATALESLAKAVGAGIMAPNEARLRRNLPPVAGGEMPYLQQQNYSLAALSQRPPPDTTPEPPAQATEAEAAAEEAAGQLRSALSALTARQTDAAEQLKSVLAAVDGLTQERRAAAEEQGQRRENTDSANAVAGALLKRLREASHAR